MSKRRTDNLRTHLDDARRRLAAAEGLLRRVVRETSGHQHWDNTMRHGAGCELCIRQRKFYEEIDRALASTPTAEPPLCKHGITGPCRHCATTGVLAAQSLMSTSPGKDPGNIAPPVDSREPCVCRLTGGACAGASRPTALDAAKPECGCAPGDCAIDDGVRLSGFRCRLASPPPVGPTGMEPGQRCTRPLDHERTWKDGHQYDRATELREPWNHGMGFRCPYVEPPAGPVLPAEVMAVLRDTSITLPGEEEAMNLALSRGARITDAMQRVIARGCSRCMTAEHPYWHPADRPCPTTNTPATLTSPPPAGPVCASWCGTTCDPWPSAEVFSGAGGLRGKLGCGYCTEACRDAGKPLHPEVPTAAFFTTADKPTCPECKSIMVPHGKGLKCVNCGATSEVPHGT